MKQDLEGIRIETQLEEIVFGLIRLSGAQIENAPQALSAQIESACTSFSADDERKAAVRNMLRHGKYKPTGRGKPACEYLLKAAQEARFPAINNLVDALNLVSLKTQLPISVIDTDLAGTNEFVIRRGREGESFVFNATGQEIGLHDLLLVATQPDDQACANPVKDSMRTKLTDETQNALAVVYGPVALKDAVQAATVDLASLYQLFGGPDIRVTSGFVG